MAKLDAAQRNKLPTKMFGLPDKAPKSGSYPIPDAAHARSALSRASANASPAQQKEIRSKVHRMYPDIQMVRGAGKMRNLSSMAV